MELAAGLEQASVQELGTPLTSASVTSPHTIHKGVTRDMPRELAEDADHRPGIALRPFVA